jgi:hypothetical protein
MTTNDDRLGPSWDRLGDGFEDDRFPEDSTAEDVTDLRVSANAQWHFKARRSTTYSTIGTPPHLLQLELLHSGLVRGNSRTLDTDRVLLDRLGAVNSDLVIGLPL